MKENPPVYCVALSFGWLVNGHTSLKIRSQVSRQYYLKLIYAVEISTVGTKETSAVGSVVSKTGGSCELEEHHQQVLLANASSAALPSSTMM